MPFFRHKRRYFMVNKKQDSINCVRMGKNNLSLGQSTCTSANSVDSTSVVLRGSTFHEL